MSGEAAVRSTKYKRKQISLPLEDASTMTVEQLQQLIMLQGRRIPILDWELNLLVTDCSQRKCLDKGLAILYEYAGHMDMVKRLVDIRHETALRLFQREKLSSTMDTEVIPLMIELSHVNLNILIALGNLRALQFSPKSILTPISTPMNSTNSKMLDLHTGSKRVPLDACLREESRILERVYAEPMRKIPAYCAVILLAPKVEFNDIIELISIASPNDQLVSLEAPARAVANIISIEDDITTAYKVIRNAVKTPQSPFNELQTLRLNYANYLCPGTYAWFTKALEVYSPSVITMAALMEEQKIPVTRLGTYSGKSSRAAATKRPDGNYATIEEKFSAEDDAAGDDPFGETATLVDVSAKRHLAVSVPTGGSSSLSRPRTSPAVNSKGQDAIANGGFGSTSAPGSPVIVSAGAMVPPVPQTSPTRKEGGKAAGGKFGGSRNNAGKTRPGSAKSNPLMSSTAPLATSSSNNDVRRELFDEAEEESGVILQSSPSKHKRLDGVVAPSSPIEADFAFVGGGVGSGVGTPTSKAAKRGANGRCGSTPSRKPDIKKRVGHSNQSVGGRSGNSRNVGFVRLKEKDKRKGDGVSTREKQAKMLSTKAHHALSFMSLASGPTIGFSKGESRIESQVIQISLKDANVSGQALVKLAATKISHWWHFIGPRRKLHRRMQTYRMVRSLVVDVVNESALKALKKRRTKAQLLRNGSAITIQRLVKHWFYVTRRRTPPPGGWRSKGHIRLGTDPYAMGGFTMGMGILPEQSQLSGGSGILGGGDSSPVTPRQAMRRTILHRATSMGLPAYDRQDVKEANKKKKRWNKNIAATVINGFCRMILAKRRVQRIRIRKQLELKAQKKKLVKFSREKASRVIQAHVRACLARHMIYKWVRSSWIIGRAWRRHLAYKRLRGDLRRLEKPRNIKLSSIRNLPRQFGDVDQMQIKIQVYWSGLLHIFSSEHELRSCIKGKKPQFVIYSAVVPVVKQGSRGRAKTSRGSIFERIMGASTVGGVGRATGIGLSSVSSGDAPAPMFPSLSSKAKTNLGEDAAASSSGGDIAYEANFADEELRIPGTHGNSILAFEILADDKSVAECTFLMSLHGDLMLWSQECHTPIKYKSAPKPDSYGSTNDDKSDFDFMSMEREVTRAKRGNVQTTPKFDLAGPKPEVLWRMSSGVPLTSRCGVVKVKVSAGFSLSSSGRGPVISAMYREYGILRTAITSWRKMFLSFDGEELCLWSSHNASKPLTIISKQDIAATFLKLGKPTQPYSTAVIIEDIFDLNVYTTGHEMVSFRFNDAASRVRWNETLMYALRGYDSFKVLAGSDAGTVGSDEDNYGRTVEEGDSYAIPGRSRLSMIASSAGSAMGNFARKMPAGMPSSFLSNDDPEPYRGHGGRRRRASKLVDQMAIESLAARLPQISSTRTDSDDSDDSDTDSNGSDEE